MPWWGWLLLGWVALALVVGFWVAAAAAIARRRERAARAYRYQDNVAAQDIPVDPSIGSRPARATPQVSEGGADPTPPTG
jgi:hypothetical protein